MTDRELALMLYGALGAVLGGMPEGKGEQGVGVILSLANEHLWPPPESFTYSTPDELAAHEGATTP